jgi:hypothetical protein
MATPPKHKSALILGHLREGLGTACLPDSGLAGYQYKLTSARKHPVKRRPKYIKFARSTDYGPALFPAIGWQSVHSDLILARFTMRQCTEMGKTAMRDGVFFRLKGIRRVESHAITRIDESRPLPLKRSNPYR